MVVLKRLSDAKRDGDRILALVRGSAINQDGKSGGLTVPNGPAQESVIRDALAVARLEGSDIDYVEAHGTGTSLGDPIEVRALGRVLGEGRDPDTPLLIGSVKTNIGHLEVGGRRRGLHQGRVVAAARNHPEASEFQATRIPSSSGRTCRSPSPTRAKPWTRGARPRRAGVSSFGFSGTNAHVILEEAPPEVAPVEGVDRPLHCLTVSAQSEASLRELARRYAEALAPEKALQLVRCRPCRGNGTRPSHAPAGDRGGGRSRGARGSVGGECRRSRSENPPRQDHAGPEHARSFSSTPAPALNIQEWAARSIRHRRCFATPSIIVTGCLGPDAKGRTLKSVLWDNDGGRPAHP